MGRWGGDEFAAVLYDTARDRAAATAERIQSAFQKAAAEIDERTVDATVSTGMVFSDKGALDLAALMVQADQALYRAKARGRNRIVIASPDTVWANDDDSGTAPAVAFNAKVAG